MLSTNDWKSYTSHMQVMWWVSPNCNAWLYEEGKKWRSWACIIRKIRNRYSQIHFSEWKTWSWSYVHFSSLGWWEELQKMVKTYAMLDNYSQGSLIKEKIIKEFKITGRKLTISLKTLTGWNLKNFQQQAGLVRKGAWSHKCT